MAVENLTQAELVAGLIQRISADTGSNKRQNAIEAVPQLFELLKSALLNDPIIVGSIQMTPSEGWENVGEEVTFTKSDYGAEVDIIIPGVLEITRDDNKGIYNRAAEPAYDNSGYTSPFGTEWTSHVVEDAFDYDKPVGFENWFYRDWAYVRDFGDMITYPAGIVGLETIMHETFTNRYFKIKFLSWTEGAMGGGFSYVRQEIKAVEPDTITFPDGSKMSSAGAGDFIGLIDTPNTYTDPGSMLAVNAAGDGLEWVPAVSGSWDINNVAFLSTFGNDATAERGDGNKPYRTFNAANADGASVIFIKDGTWGTETLVSNKTYYFYPGTQMYRMRDAGATVTNTKVLGYLKFRSFSYGVELTGAGSDISVECDEFDNVRSIAFIQNGSACRVKVRKAFANGFNGGGYACAVRDGSSLELTVTESLTLYYWSAAFRGTGNSYILRCPDIRQINGGNYGSPGFCTLVNHQGSITQGNTYLVDFMGGKLTRTRGQGSSFGVRDSVLLTFVNTYGGAVPTNVKFQNGRIDAGSVLGVLIEYIVLSGQVELDNIKIKTTSRPIEMYQRANNSSGGPYYCKFITRNCSFEGGLPVRLGNFRIARFYNSHFKTLDGASIIDFNNVNGNSPGQAYFVNCTGHLAAGGGEMLTGFTGKTIGLLNTYSDVPLGAGAVDTWSGHAEIPTYELPDLEL